jgi:catechol 2,3-dioxygenase-like lactoylglutathione lyase family enzyme
MTITPRIDAIGLVASDLARTLTFYRAAGCDLPDPAVTQLGVDDHLEAELGGGVRLMFDTEEVVRSFADDTWSGGGTGRLTLAAQCDSPAEVDRLHEELAALGGGSQLAPFDAEWGMRYASVFDPDGVIVHLYADLPGQ